jgi:hypothetical protein
LKKNRNSYKTHDYSRTAVCIRRWLCIDSNGYHPVFKKLSQKVQYFKESQKGVNEMGNVFDEYAEKRANDERKIFAAKLLEDATFAVSKIAELTGLSEQEVENLKQTIA